MNIGENIKSYRMKNGLTQKELGDMLIWNGCPISGKTVSSWEVNRTEPKIGLIEQMCKIFNCQKSDLLGSDEYGFINDKNQFQFPFEFDFPDPIIFDSLENDIQNSKNAINKELSKYYSQNHVDTFWKFIDNQEFANTLLKYIQTKEMQRKRELDEINKQIEALEAKKKRLEEN